MTEVCDEVVWDHDPLREQEWGSLGASADDSYDPADSPGWDVPSRSLTDSASSSFEFESGLLADAERLRNTVCLQLANPAALPAPQTHITLRAARVLAPLSVILPASSDLTTAACTRCARLRAWRAMARQKCRPRPGPFRLPHAVPGPGYRAPCSVRAWSGSRLGRHHLLARGTTRIQARFGHRGAGTGCP